MHNLQAVKRELKSGINMIKLSWMWWKHLIKNSSDDGTFGGEVVSKHITVSGTYLL